MLYEATFEPDDRSGEFQSTIFEAPMPEPGPIGPELGDAVLDWVIGTWAAQFTKSGTVVISSYSPRRIGFCPDEPNSIAIGVQLEEFHVDFPLVCHCCGGAWHATCPVEQYQEMMEYADGDVENGPRVVTMPSPSPTQHDPETCDFCADVDAFKTGGLLVIDENMEQES